MATRYYHVAHLDARFGESGRTAISSCEGDPSDVSDDGADPKALNDQLAFHALCPWALRGTWFLLKKSVFEANLHLQWVRAPSRQSVAVVVSS